MSDEDYEAFLDKANQDTSGSGPASTTSAPEKKVGTKSVDTEVPKPLEAVEAYYTSDADEPFEPVSLQWKGEGLPSEGMCSVVVPSTSTIVCIGLQKGDSGACVCASRSRRKPEEVADLARVRRRVSGDVANENAA